MRAFADLFQAGQAAAGAALNALARCPNPTKPAAATPAMPNLFQSWFQSVQVEMAAGLPGSYVMNRIQTSSAEGAAEALRLVQQYVPEATIQSEYFSSPYFSSDKPIYSVELPDGTRMNAGLILDRYYAHGLGAGGASEMDLASELRQLTCGSERV